MPYRDYPAHAAGGPHYFAWFLLFLLIGLLILLIFFVLTRWDGRPRPVAAAAPGVTGAGDDAHTLVRLRYARGEIDRDTFLQVSQDLAGAPPPG